MRLDEFDGIIIGSPVYYSAPTGQLVSFLNRLFYATEGRMAGKLGAAVASCRRGGASATFEQLNQYFTIANMPVVASQYWNSMHGFTPDDVRKDKEGLQTMRTLGQNMVWLLKCIESGRKTVSPGRNMSRGSARTSFRTNQNNLCGRTSYCIRCPFLQNATPAVEFTRLAQFVPGWLLTRLICIQPGLPRKTASVCSIRPEAVFGPLHDRRDGLPSF